MKNVDVLTLGILFLIYLMTGFFGMLFGVVAACDIHTSDNENRNECVTNSVRIILKGEIEDDYKIKRG